jgi:hypothetical protein
MQRLWSSPEAARAAWHLRRGGAFRLQRAPPWPRCWPPPAWHLYWLSRHELKVAPASCSTAALICATSGSHGAGTCVTPARAGAAERLLHLLWHNRLLQARRLGGSVAGAPREPACLCRAPTRVAVAHPGRVGLVGHQPRLQHLAAHDGQLLLLPGHLAQQLPQPGAAVRRREVPGPVADPRPAAQVAPPGCGGCAARPAANLLLLQRGRRRAGPPAAAGLGDPAGDAQAPLHAPARTALRSMHGGSASRWGAVLGGLWAGSMQWHEVAPQGHHHPVYLQEQAFSRARAGFGNPPFTARTRGTDKCAMHHCYCRPDRDRAILRPTPARFLRRAARPLPCAYSASVVGCHFCESSPERISASHRSAPSREPEPHPEPIRREGTAPGAGHPRRRRRRHPSIPIKISVR